MMQELKRYQVDIFGESYTVVSDESQKEVTDTAAFVDALMKETAGKSTVDPKKVAIFVAFKMAKKMLDLEAEKVKWVEVEKSLVKLIEEQISFK